MRTLLITGGAGFIGSNLVTHILETRDDVKIINLDALTYASDLNNLKTIADHPNYLFVEGDIRNRELVDGLFEEHDIQGVMHLAAESHVDNSISNPSIFIETNVNGTFNLVDAAYKHWMDKPFAYKAGYENCRFLHVSTDEVYGTLGETGLFTEETPYAPNSPYSASKASSDHIIRSYHHTYGLNTVITNCSNNYGPNQHNEKLIPTVIRKALHGEHIPIYGDGSNIRDWLYVLDHCKGIELAYMEGKAGHCYNIGGRNERNNNQIARTICTLLDAHKPKDSGSYKDQIRFVEDRAGHDFRYAIDATKIEGDLGWNAKENFESGILKTIEWYAAKYSG